MSKIALCIIAKNNEATLPRLLDSVAKHVDAIYLTDTGSTDRTVAIAKEYGAKVSNFKWKKDFAAARNFNLSQVSKDYDYLLWLDTDDILEGGEHLRVVAHQMSAQGLTAVYFQYNYTIDRETGQVLVEHSRERLVKRGVYEWKGRIHEVLVPKGKQEAVRSDLVTVNHYPEEEQEVSGMERNLEILQLQLADEGGSPDPRTEYYLARQYFDLDRYEEAAKLFECYLEHSGWDEERGMAWNYLGEICKNEKDYETAIDCYLSAVKERPDYPTWYVNIGMTYELMGKHDLALHWTKMALGIPGKTKTAMVLNPRDDAARTLETLFFANFHLGKLDEAWAAAHKLNKLIPKNEVFEERLKGITDLRRWGKMTEAAIEMADEVAGEDQGKLEAFLNSLPGPVMGNSAMTKYKNQVLPPKTWPEKSIVYFCGKGFEKWDPTNLEKGIGGSESAVIYLSKEWVKQGYSVTVFGYPHKEGMYEDVDYQFYWRFNPSDTFDTFISWRNETLFKLPIKARKKLLDLHDVPNQSDLPDELVSSIDTLMVKSQYHTSFLPDVPKEKFAVVSNGIEVMPGKSKRDPYLMSYVSSYDRGLEHLLKMWPQIKERVPEAKLEIAYGWDMFDKVMGNNPERQMWKKRMETLMAQDGITHRGRISKAELHDLHRRASIMAYYCIFEEINCISVLEAQANGSYPVTTDFAALKETNRYGTKVSGDPYDKSTKEEYVKAITHSIASYQGEDGKHLGSLFMKSAIKQDYYWPGIATKWLEVINGD